MAQLVATRNAYVRCGLVQIQGQEDGTDILINAGFTSPASFSLLTHDGLDSIISRVRKEEGREFERLIAAAQAADEAIPLRPLAKINDLAQAQLHGFLMWAKEKYAMGTSDPSPVDFDQATVLQMARRYAQGKQESPSSVVKTPGKLTSQSVWSDWDDKFRLYLESIQGVNNGCPLIYVIRDDPATPAANFAYASDIERQILNAGHSGNSFLLDKATVFAIILDCCLKESSETHIQAQMRSRDGRAAYLALRMALQGGANAELELERAHKILDETVYRGELPTFGIKDLNSRFSKAFQVFVRVSTGLDGAEQMRRYLKAFKDNVHPMVKASIATIEATALYQNDFVQSSGFMERMMLKIDWPNARRRAVAGVSTAETLSDGSPIPEKKFYPYNHYRNVLTQAQRDYLEANRVTKGKKDRAKKRNHSIKALSKKAQKEQNKLVRRIKALEAKAGGAVSDSDDDEVAKIPPAGDQFQKKGKGKKDT